MDTIRCTPAYKEKSPVLSGGFSAVAQNLLDAIGEGVVFIDELGIIRFINARVEELLRLNRNQVIDRRVDMLPLRTPLYKILSENSRDFPVEISGNGMVLLVQTREFRAGTVSGDLVEIRDITQERKERRQREEYVAMMTHDLKSPLTVMMGYIQAMREGTLGELPEPVHPCLEELDRSSARLLRMIEDILDAYRLEVGLLSINRDPADMAEILRDSCHSIEQEAQAKGICYSVSIADTIPPMNVDEKQLGRAFTNLLSNAVKFTPRGGRVSAVALVLDDQLQFTVEDTGIGIPAKDLPRIFNKYYRSHGAEGYKGTGLGLAISKAIIEAHEGTIGVESSDGSGSRFTVILPL